MAIPGSVRQPSWSKKQYDKSRTSRRSTAYKCQGCESCSWYPFRCELEKLEFALPENIMPRDWLGDKYDVHNSARRTAR